MQAFKQQYLILSAQQYRMVDEDTGVVNEGISLWYIPSDNLEPTADEAATGRGDIVRGIKVAKASLPLSLKPKMSYFPALYDVTLEMATVAQKLQVKVKDIDFVTTVKLAPEKSGQQPKTASA